MKIHPRIAGGIFVFFCIIFAIILENILKIELTIILTNKYFIIISLLLLTLVSIFFSKKYYDNDDE